MDTELQKLKLLRSFNLRTDSFRFRNTSTTNTADPDIEYDHAYTSLKDILVNSPPQHQHNAFNQEGGGPGASFNSSDISIRNVLVKHAASAYVQSAILVNRNHSCLADLLERIRNYRVSSARNSCWSVRVKEPFRACFRMVFRFIDQIVHGVGRVWRERIALR